MTEISRPWGGTVLGDAGPYSDDQWTDLWKTFLAHVVASQGVFRDQLNEFNLTDLPGLPVTPLDVGSGRALVNGIWYESDATEQIAIVSPVGNPRIVRIVLRADWVAQTVRVTDIVGAIAAPPVPPAIVQIDGVTWDLPLWQVHVTPGGAISAYRDERAFIGQYVPVGVSDSRVYLEWEFFGPAAYASGDNIGPFEANLVGGGTITPLALAGFGAGAIELRMDGAGVNTIAEVFSRSHRPDQINGHLVVFAKAPNTDPSLDLFIGFGSSLSLTPVNGVFFRSNGGAVWETVCRAGGVETAQPTILIPDDVWRKFEIRQTGIDTVAFLIDDVVIEPTIQTNIPNDQTLDLDIGAFDDGAGTPPANPYLHLDSVTLRGDR